MEFRTAQGFDVHAFCDGNFVILCGVKIPFYHGLAGHSDADVALHAITDAILGSIAEKDIGHHFPPNDAKWKDTPSDIFVYKALALLQKRQAILKFCDLTLICEQPKIAPYHGELCANLAKILNLESSRISVKATTTEKLGFTGRGEGIAALALVNIVLND